MLWIFSWEGKKLSEYFVFYRMLNWKQNTQDPVYTSQLFQLHIIKSVLHVLTLFAIQYPPVNIVCPEGYQHWYDIMNYVFLVQLY